MQTSDKLTTLVSWILKIAVFISIGFVTVGSILMFIFNGADGYSISQIESYNSSINLTSKAFSPVLIPSGLLALNPIAFISLGLWVLIFTPVTVLFSSLVDYIYMKNKLYVILTFLVLFNLFTAILIIPAFVKL
ncbi:MAG: DUF1634 domain-containing protein [Candidatus Thermoplasmatota archaeon]|jgi:uncharacterized membrane protein|nr:DUF1634 domain-containing protein [Candidatus Thermoplasmatota archaeon]MCL5791200.1 DUF1634 domain-containing protein [Candidatus Thermoplasmatota archaeon]